MIANKSQKQFLRNLSFTFIMSFRKYVGNLIESGNSKIK